MHSGWLIALFFAVITAEAAVEGVGNIAFNDTLARVIPIRLRGQARSWRGIFGSLMAAIAALLIRSYFSDPIVVCVCNEHIARTIRGGTSARCSSRLGGCSVTCFMATTTRLSPRNGTSPVSSS